LKLSNNPTFKWFCRHANEFVITSHQDCWRCFAVRQRCVDESHFLYGLCCPGEWLGWFQRYGWKANIP